MKKMDVAIVGGGLAGCFAAIKAAQKGLKVVLIEKSTFLGREFCAYHRAWIGTEGADEYAEELREFFFNEEEKYQEKEESFYPAVYGHETPLFLGTVRKQLLEKLLEHKVQVLFMSHIAGVAVSGKRAGGLLLANKYGLQLLRVREIIDMTEEKNVMRLLKQENVHSDAMYKVYYTIEFEDVILPIEEYIPVSDKLGVEGNKVKIHRGKKASGNAIIEFSYLFHSQENQIFTKSSIENKSRRIACDLIVWLHNNNGCFRNATPANIGYESYVEGRYPPDFPANDYRGIYTIPAILPWEFGWKDVFSIKKKAEACVDGIAAGIEEDVALPEPEVIISGDSLIPLVECKISKVEDDGLNIELEAVKFDVRKYVSRKYCCDILIAGGGTGGVMTGIAAGGNNRNTLLVEIHQDFGGTRTQGFVSGYWHGYRGGFTKVTDEKIADLTEMMTGEKNERNRIARMLFYHKTIAETGCKFLLSTQICDTVLDQTHVKGGLAVNEDGMLAIESKVTVDATGDGDVAYFAGAAYSFGDSRDGNVQSFSMWGMETRKVNNFRESYFLKDVDVINQGKYSELLRGIVQSHMHNSPYYFANMLTVREGRRIHGEYELNINDVLDSKEFNDCISVALCPLDTHGRKSSWFSLLGLFARIAEKDIQVRIPYRCCIPKGFHGILVTAKAISATRDAACLCRMNADIQNLGYACGLAAAMAAAENTDVRDIPLTLLQKRLQKEEVLPFWALEKKTEAMTVEKQTELLKKGNLEAFFEVLRKPKEEMLAILTKEFNTASGDEKVHIAKALAWFGSTAGSELLVQELEELAARGITGPNIQLKPGQTNIISQEIKENLNDYWKMNQLIVLLGISGDKRAIDAICHVVEKSEAGGAPEVKTTPYHAGRVDVQRIPMYERIICLCFALERLADNKAIPALEKLIDRKYIGGGYISESSWNVKNFFSAYLELKVAGTLARCGSRKGTGLLIDYLKDIHYILRKYAYEELKSISGADFGMKAACWRDWLDRTGMLEAKPVINYDAVI